VGFRVPVYVDACATLLGLLRMGNIVCILDPKAPEAYAQDRCMEVGTCMDILPDDMTGPERLTRDPGLHMLTSDPPYWYSIADPAIIVFTSGSTGRPKAAVLSMGNMMAAAQLANLNMPLVPGDGWLLSLGIHHVAGLGILFRCWTAGAAVVLPPPDASLAEAVMDPRVTHLSLVPTQLHRLMENPAHTRRLAAMKGILLGGAPSPEALIRRAHAAGLPIHTGYGMTETCAQICATPPGASLDKLLTSGWPLGEDAVRISPEGEIEVGGPTRFLGYWDEGRLVQPFTKDSWFRTGDLGHLNARNCLTVTGRRDNMFIAGGENIQPEEVEAVLCALPDVAEAVVVPVPHDAFGATPAAFVRMDDGSAPDGDALRAALLEKLPKFKVPRHWFPWPETAQQGLKIRRKSFIERADHLLNNTDQTDQSD
jgi:O-succinylbenzoic acid--CoA ligase